MQQQSFYESTQQLPQTPNSAGILINNAARAANERRGHHQQQPQREKSIMNCFRDRTPTSYSRSNSNIARDIQVSTQYLNLRSPERIPAKELRSTVRPIQLTLLKSTSTRDLSRFLEFDAVPTTNQQTYKNNSFGDLNKMTSSSTSISSSSAVTQNTSSSSSPSAVNSCPYTNCSKHIQKLETRIAELETNFDIYRQSMASQFDELNRKFEQLQKESNEHKRKKSSSPRQIKKENSAAASSSTTTGSGGGATQVQPSKLVAWLKLSNFWKQRPSIQTLKEQNIYNDEPCFDTEIEMVLKDEQIKTVPKIVVHCCQLIEEKYRKSSEPIEGIYRQSGDYNKIQALRFSIDANNYEALKQHDVHTLTGVLKLFLREIKSPLISANEAKTFIGKPNQWLLTDLACKLEILKRLIRSLPEVNRDTMEFLFAHFNKLTKVPLQQISAETLAISLAPSIFHTVQQGAHVQDMHMLLKECEILSDCVKIMIEYHHKIFECTADRKQQKHRISVRNLRKTLSHPDLIFQTLF